MKKAFKAVVSLSLLGALIVATFINTRRMLAEYALMYQRRLDHAIMWWPDEPRYTMLQGAIELKTGHYRAAAFTYLRILNDDPYNLDARSNLAAAYAAQGAKEAAKLELRRVLELWPWHEAARANLRQLETKR